MWVSLIYLMASIVLCAIGYRLAGGLFSAWMIRQRTQSHTSLIWGCACLFPFLFHSDKIVVSQKTSLMCLALCAIVQTIMFRFGTDKLVELSQFDNTSSGLIKNHFMTMLYLSIKFLPLWVVAGILYGNHQILFPLMLSCDLGLFALYVAKKHPFTNKLLGCQKNPFATAELITGASLGCVLSVFILTT